MILQGIVLLSDLFYSPSNNLTNTCAGNKLTIPKCVYNLINEYTNEYGTPSFQDSGARFILISPGLVTGKYCENRRLRVLSRRRK